MHVKNLLTKCKGSTKIKHAPSLFNWFFFLGGEQFWVILVCACFFLIVCISCTELLLFSYSLPPLFSHSIRICKQSANVILQGI